MRSSQNEGPQLRGFTGTDHVCPTLQGVGRESAMFSAEIHVTKRAELFARFSGRGMAGRGGSRLEIHL